MPRFGLLLAASTLQMDAELIRLIGEGATVVTPTRRLARDLKRRFDAAQIEGGCSTWPSADILPWSSWLDRTFANLARSAGNEQVLNPAQQLAVWHDVIGNAASADTLLDAAATGRIAREAWEIQQSWRLDLDRWRGGWSDDGAAYLGWEQRFRDRCAQRNWLDPARLADAVGERLRLDGEGAPHGLVLYGFDQLTPQMQDLLESCRAAGARVDQRHPVARPGRAVRSAHLTREDELIDVAERIQCLLRADPTVRIGVVVPDLARRRAEVVRVFDDALEPARVLPVARTTSRPYNVSLGPPLNRYPLVHAALLILRLVQGHLTLADLGVLLRSPFLAAAEQEFCRRAQLDARLRRRGRLVVDLETLQRLAHAEHRDDPGACRALSTRLMSWRGLAQQARGRRQLPSAWSSTLLALLTGLGWPGERTLDSEDYQTYLRWREFVLSLAHLDAVVGALSYQDVLAWLVRLCGDTLFQPETEEVPVQVLGVLEAAGIGFDHLFVTGLTDEAWPAAAHPNALLPAALQRMHQVPHASAEWEVGFARRMTAFWLAAAPRVTLSHPTRDGDRVLRPSPLVTQLPEVSAVPRAAANPSRSSYANAIQAMGRQELLADFAGPPVVAPYEVQGGTAVFRNQAACPFRAFAVHRLGARGLEEARAGLSAAERGILVHEAARHLWGELASQARLLSMTEAELQTAIGHAVDAAIEMLRARRPDALTEPFVDLERARLRPLLADLLALERQRAPFRVIQRERGALQDIAGLIVEARPDRVDELEAGVQAILDYKTGTASASAWLGVRPDEPQLPLYAIAHDRDVAAVSFVLLRPGQVSFRGLARADQLLPGVPAVERALGTRECGGWSGLLQQWRTVCEALAREFVAGHAAVTPKDYPRTCEYCELGALCRINEIVGAAAESEDQTDVDG